MTATAEPGGLAELVAELVAELRAIRVAEERQADALERIAAEPTSNAPAPRRRRRVRVPIPEPEDERPVDELSRERARRALKRLGLGEA